MYFFVFWCMLSELIIFAYQLIARASRTLCRYTAKDFPAKCYTKWYKFLLKNHLLQFNIDIHSAQNMFSCHVKILDEIVPWWFCLSLPVIKKSIQLTVLKLLGCLERGKSALAPVDSLYKFFNQGGTLPYYSVCHRSHYQNGLLKNVSFSSQISNCDRYNTYLNCRNNSRIITINRKCFSFISVHQLLMLFWSHSHLC